MALLDRSYGLFSALSVAKDLSLLAGEAAEDLSELAEYVEAASHHAQLMPHLQQRRFLNKAAAASTRQLELMSAHLQSATSLASLQGRALECAKVLLLTPTYLPHVWLDHSAPSIRETVSTQVQRDLADAGMIAALGQAMTVAAAALRRLVPQGQLESLQQVRQLLNLFRYVLALLNTWYAFNDSLGNESSTTPWPSTYPAYAALSAALLEATSVLLAVAEVLSPAGAQGGSTSNSRGRGGRSTRVSSSFGMDESMDLWQQREAWLDICTRSVATLAVAGILFDVKLFTAARFDRRDPHLMGLLGSRDVLSMLVCAAAGTARSLHKAAGGKLPVPAAAAAAAAAPAGSSSSSRRNQVQQQQQRAVPASHDLLFEALGGSSLLTCVELQAASALGGADSQWHPPPPALHMRALSCVNTLRMLLLGQAADPGPDRVTEGFSAMEGLIMAAMGQQRRAPLVPWPPAATFTPQRQQQLVGPLMQVVVELLLLVPDGADGKQDALLEGLELLHHLAGLQQHSAPGLVAMVEPVLLLLGPAVTRAVKQQQQGAASAWAVEAWQRYGLLLARLLRSVDIAEHAAPMFAKQPAAAAICEAALRAQLLDAAAASNSSNPSQPEHIWSNARLTAMAGDLAGLVHGTTVAAATEAAKAAVRASSSNISDVVLPPALLCLLVSCLKIISRVTAATGGALLAASQGASVLATAAALCPAQLTGEGGASSSAAAPLRQLLEDGSLSWAVLAGRALFCIGQALAQLPQGDDVTSSLQGQETHMTLISVMGERALDALSSQLQQLRSQLPAAEVDRWLQTAAAVTPLVAAAKPPAAGGSNSGGSSISSSDKVSLTALGKQLQALGSLAATWLPSPYVCNNPACVTVSTPGAAAGVSGLSEKGLVAKGRCSGCQLSRYCSNSCLAAHWKGGHKAVCKQLQAGSGSAC